MSAAAVMRKTVGRNLLLTLLTRNSLGWLQTPAPAAPDAPASMCAGFCPFTTFIRESLLGQEVLRCPQAVLVRCLQNEKEVVALVGQALPAVHGCGCDLQPVIWHWGDTSHLSFFANVLLFCWFWLGGLQVNFWYKQEKGLVLALRRARPTAAVLPL